MSVREIWGGFFIVASESSIFGLVWFGLVWFYLIASGVFPDTVELCGIVHFD